MSGQLWFDGAVILLLVLLAIRGPRDSGVSAIHQQTLDAHQRDLDAKGRTLAAHQEHLGLLGEQLRRRP